MFIIIDGIDGSGKSTVVETWKEYLAKQGNAIFDLTVYWKEHGEYPAYSQLKPYDFIFSGEPTYVGIGKVIREELIKKDTDYPPLAIAEAYSLDRLILYHKIIIPALKNKKIIIQDRGISTSLCYQPLMHQELTVGVVSRLPGNALALEHRPDHLVLLEVDADSALARLQGRHDKQDNVIFEQHSFQQRATDRFASPEYQKLFTTRGARVHSLQAQPDLGIMKESSIQLLATLFDANSYHKS